MLKLLDLDMEFFGEEPTVTILDFEKAGKGLTKKAADSRIQSYTSQLKFTFIY
jgi:hypothetical protein